jgi:ribosome-associated translation inhibitor RaiA
VTHQEETKAPFAAHTTKHDKRLAGRTDAAATQLELRSGGEELEPGLHDWVYERIGRQLGKFATQIERVQVRFGDENGPKGGNDKCCMVHVVLAKLPPVVVEIRGDTQREAFDLAASRAERAVRRSMEKHGVSTHRHKHKDHGGKGAMTDPPDGLLADGAQALEAGDEESDEEMSTEDGADHTAERNEKGDDAGMAYRLEDSATGKPSRKSTRGASNHIKHGNPLTQRTKAAIHSPKEQATRAAVHKP